MRWKKAVIVIAIVFVGALGRAAALGTNGVEEQGCWSDYANDVIQVWTDFESCVEHLSLFGSLGSELCAFIYAAEAEAALAQFISCALGIGFGLVG
jgi:hypothetical protein